MNPRILLTGFEAFGDVETNPSQKVVEALGAGDIPGIDLVTAVLPVSYAAAGDCIRNLVRENRPDYILSTGVAAKRGEICLERVALNLDDAAGPDNDGVVRDGQPILPDGPPAYFSTLPLSGLKARLAEAGLPVRISNHAGAYLCNHAYYAAADEAARLDLPAGVVFVHVPLPVEAGGESGVTMQAIEQAVRLSLEWLAAEEHD